MSSPQTPSGTTAWKLKEVRYSLRELQAEVALERKAGAFGQQKLHQAEIAKLFPAQKRKRKHNASGS